MADSTTSNISLTKPEVGASADSWGTKINTNFDTLDNLFTTGPALLLTKGGTGATTASAARTNLGLGTVATESTVPVAKGGTGATSITSGALIKGAGTSAFSAASAADIVGQIGSTAVTNATNATTSTTQSNGNNSTSIATTAYVQNMGLGWGQSWSNVTGSRSAGTTYTNSTGKPIVVVIGIGDDNQSAYIYVNSIATAKFGYQISATTVVPNGSTYYIDSGITFGFWSELR